MHKEVIECDQPWMGPWLFGISLDILLFGILTVQIYMYYLAFPQDRRLLKLAVAVVYLVGTIQTIQALVDFNGAINDPLHLKTIGPGCGALFFSFGSRTCLTVIASSSTVALTVQWLYAYRIYIISQKPPILILVVCLSLGQFGSSIVGCICVNGPSVFTLLNLREKGLCRSGFEWVWGPLNVLCDATITVSMSILLLRRRKVVLKMTTHAHVTKAIRLIVETGLITSIVVVVYTVTYDLAPVISGSWTVRTAWLIPGLTMGKVHSNSMLALLNSRFTIVGGRNMGDPFVISEIRSEVLRTEVGEEQTTSVVNRRRASRTNEEISATS